jgi:hypothetical protein
MCTLSGSLFHWLITFQLLPYSGIAHACADELACSRHGLVLTDPLFLSTVATPTCSDGIKNGNETGVDCGGPSCPKCGTGGNCTVSSDCVSNNCVAVTISVTNPTTNITTNVTGNTCAAGTGIVGGYLILRLASYGRQIQNVLSDVLWFPARMC